MSMVETELALRLVEIEGRGRALVASQPLKAGQIVLRDSPILIYSAFPLIKHQSSASYCDNCFRMIPLSTNATPCTSCSYNHLFCSLNCFTAARGSSHSTWVCQALSRLRECPSLILQPVEHQVQARFLVAAYNLALVSPSQFQVLLSLQGEGSPSDASAALVLHSLIASLCPPPSLCLSMELTAALLAKDKLNAFGLMEPSLSIQKDGQRSVRAYGIYPMASFFNHDCLPNACRFDYLDSAPDHNTDIIVRMIHDIPQCREICLSYFPVNLNYSIRQKRLLEDYGFTCDCDRCKIEANWSDNEADAIASEDNENEEELMDEDDEEQMAASDIEQEAAGGDTDFPHAYFFLRYMCNQENCWGTLAPLPPSDSSPSKLLECNVCGNLKNDEEH